MSNQTPEEFIHSLVERYDLSPADEPFVLHLSDINALATAEAVLKSRADEIALLNNMLDQLDQKVNKLTESLVTEQEKARKLSMDLKEARNSLEDYAQTTKSHDDISARLREAEWALRVILYAEPSYHGYVTIARAIDKVFDELRCQLTIDDAKVPF